MNDESGDVLKMKLREPQKFCANVPLEMHRKVQLSEHTTERREANFSELIKSATGSHSVQKSNSEQTLKLLAEEAARLPSQTESFSLKLCDPQAVGGAHKFKPQAEICVAVHR